ncbi:hypothetical protein SAMN04488580_102319 [Mycobacterium sp. 283mftsu]|nr:hypothetical protein SAMN04488580_102319 [Mycobacterium sp. 283mftsu]
MVNSRIFLAAAWSATGVYGALVAGSPAAHAYDSWCDLVETHAPRIAVVSEPLRTGNDQLATDRLNDFYTKVIPQLNTVASATFWYPNVWGSPDIRTDTRSLMNAMADLQDVANEYQPAAAQVAAVDDALARLHRQCEGHRGLPPRPQQ